MRRTTTPPLIALAVALACSAGGSGANSRGSAGGAAGSTAGTSAAGGAAAAGGTFGFGGVGGGGNVGGVADGGECESLSQTAMNQIRPVDIIWAVDTTSSMNLAADGVQNELNNFASFITNQGIDVRVVMIAKKGCSDALAWINPEIRICIAPPLGNGIQCVTPALGPGTACPNDDKLPGFFHIDNKINNNDALKQFVDHYPTYKAHLRQNAVKYFAVISDDSTDATYDPAWFTQQLVDMNVADPGYFDVWRFFSIACQSNCFLLCKNGASGSGYVPLATQTGGISADLCAGAAGFAQVFQQLAQSVTDKTTLDCEWAIPPPPPGEQFEKNKVNVDYFPGGAGPAQPILHVDTIADCDPGKGGGWYYDDDANPTKVRVCPSNCDTISSDLNGRIDVKFGCFTVDVPK